MNNHNRTSQGLALASNEINGLAPVVALIPVSRIEWLYRFRRCWQKHPTPGGGVPGAFYADVRPKSTGLRRKQRERMKIPPSAPFYPPLLMAVVISSSLCTYPLPGHGRAFFPGLG